MNRFVILGIHGEDVTTVEKNVARVRMFIDGKDKEIDEDFDLPTSMPPGLDPHEPSVYTWFLQDKIEARMKELEGKK